MTARRLCLYIAVSSAAVLLGASGLAVAAMALLLIDTALHLPMEGEL